MPQRAPKVSIQTWIRALGANQCPLDHSGATSEPHRQCLCSLLDRAGFARRRGTAARPGRCQVLPSNTVVWWTVPLGPAVTSPVGARAHSHMPGWNCRVTQQWVWAGVGQTNGHPWTQTSEPSNCSTADLEDTCLPSVPSEYHVAWSGVRRRQQKEGVLEGGTSPPSSLWLPPALGTFSTRISKTRLTGHGDSLLLPLHRAVPCPGGAPKGLVSTLPPGNSALLPAHAEALPPAWRWELSSQCRDALGALYLGSIAGRV